MLLEKSEITYELETSEAAEAGSPDPIPITKSSGQDAAVKADLGKFWAVEAQEVASHATRQIHRAFCPSDKAFSNDVPSWGRIHKALRLVDRHAANLIAEAQKEPSPEATAATLGIVQAGINMLFDTCAKEIVTGFQVCLLRQRPWEVAHVLVGLQERPDILRRLKASQLVLAARQLASLKNMPKYKTKSGRSFEFFNRNRQLAEIADITTYIPKTTIEGYGQTRRSNRPLISSGRWRLPNNGAIDP